MTNRTRKIIGNMLFVPLAIVLVAAMVVWVAKDPAPTLFFFAVIGLAITGGIVLSGGEK